MDSFEEMGPKKLGCKLDDSDFHFCGDYRRDIQTWFCDSGAMAPATSMVKLTMNLVAGYYVRASYLYSLSMQCKNISLMELLYYYT